MPHCTRKMLAWHNSIYALPILDPETAILIGVERV